MPQPISFSFLNEYAQIHSNYVHNLKHYKFGFKHGYQLTDSLYQQILEHNLPFEHDLSKNDVLFLYVWFLTAEQGS